MLDLRPVHVREEGVDVPFPLGRPVIDHERVLPHVHHEEWPEPGRMPMLVQRNPVVAEAAGLGILVQRCPADPPHRGHGHEIAPPALEASERVVEPLVERRVAAELDEVGSQVLEIELVQPHAVVLEPEASRELCILGRARPPAACQLVQLRVEPVGVGDVPDVELEVCLDLQVGDAVEPLQLKVLDLVLPHRRLFHRVAPERERVHGRATSCMDVRVEGPDRARFRAPPDRFVGTTRPLYWFQYIALEGCQELSSEFPSRSSQTLRREAGRRIDRRRRARASSSKNIAGGSPLTSRARTRAVRSRARASCREGRSRSSAAMSRAWLTSGAMSRSARPAAVRLILVRRASSGAVRRVTSPRAASRPTTAETELWCVSVRSASSSIDEASFCFSWCRTNTCALLMPSLASDARAEIRRVRTMRRSASITARMWPPSSSGAPFLISRLTCTGPRSVLYWLQYIV